MTNLLVHEMKDVQVHEMTNHLMVTTNHKTLIQHYISALKNLENVHNLKMEIIKQCHLGFSLTWIRKN
jgi:hypothetical protein